MHWPLNSSLKEPIIILGKDYLCFCLLNFIFFFVGNFGMGVRVSIFINIESYNIQPSN